MTTTKYFHFSFEQYTKFKLIVIEKFWEHYDITSQIVATHSFTNSKQKLDVDNSNFLFNN